MSLRTTPERVRSVIPDTSPQIDLNEIIGTANDLTNAVAAADTASILSESLLGRIETYLAAHFLALRDPQYESKSTGGASGKFQTGRKETGLKATDWGQQAIAMDLTGYLNSISQGVQQVGFTWLGKAVSEQIDFWDRN